jgi:hypothetical protein
MELGILVRGLSPEDVQFLAKMMVAVEIKKWKIRDILVEDLDKSSPIQIGIAMGQVCGRMVKNHVKKLFILPTIKQLQPSDQNAKHRAQAWEQLKETKDFLEGSKESGNDWRYATVHLPGQKKIIIFETVKPPGVEGDIFISRDDSNLLLKIKEAFRAEAVIIGEENI